MRLEPGDAVVLYTDGLLEARRDGELLRRASGSTRCSPASAQPSGPGAGGGAARRLPGLRGGELGRRLRRRRPEAHVIDLCSARRPDAADRPSRRGGARAGEHDRVDRGWRSSSAATSSSSTCTGGRRLVLAHDPPRCPATLPTLDDALDFLGRQRGRRAPRPEGARGGAARWPRRCGGTASSSGRSSAPSGPRRCARCRRVEPGVRLGADVSARTGTGSAERRGWRPLVGAGARRVLRRALPLRIAALLARAGASAAVLHCAVVSEAVVQRCHALGAPVLVWTVDDARGWPHGSTRSAWTA